MSDAQNKLLLTQLEATNAQNSRLAEQNNSLRSELSRLTNEHRTTAALLVEARIKAYDLENERDRIFENLEQLKRRYNKLHGAYVEKVKRCVALEDVFRRQKTLTGLVMKPKAVQQKTGVFEKDDAVTAMKPSAGAQNEFLEEKIAKLQTSLNEAYDIIDELEFELESAKTQNLKLNENTNLNSPAALLASLLAAECEIENQRLHKELNSLKAQRCEAITSANSLVNSNDNHNNAVEGYDNQTTRLSTTSLSSCETCSNDDHGDSASFERSALTDSLIRMAEAESHCMHRELLRCRLQNTLRSKDSNDSSATKKY